MSDESDSAPTADDVRDWVNAHGDVLFRYALTRVGSRTESEDLVQDTFLAALREADNFERRSAVRTWLIAILRNKIVDHIRRECRRREREAELDSTANFFHDGHWKVPVESWSTDPSKSMTKKEFWEALEQCKEELPSNLKFAFIMRDIEGLPIDEMCALLEISPENLHVRLHRSRLLLRACLDRNWFSI